METQTFGDFRVTHDKGKLTIMQTGAFGLAILVKPVVSNVIEVTAG